MAALSEKDRADMAQWAAAIGDLNEKEPPVTASASHTSDETEPPQV